MLVGIRLGFNPPGIAAVYSQAQLEGCVAALEEHGGQGVMFYNLAEAPRRYVDWIRPALRRVTNPSPQS